MSAIATSPFTLTAIGVIVAAIVIAGTGGKTGRRLRR